MHINSLVHILSLCVGLAVNTLYIDNTYCHPNHEHPPRDQATLQGIEMVRGFIGRNV
jgi:hypothetical protein